MVYFLNRRITPQAIIDNKTVILKVTHNNWNRNNIVPSGCLERDKRIIKIQNIIYDPEGRKE